MRLSDKYRPRTFEDLVGQDDVASTLGALVKRDEPAPILLSGPWGTGKTSAALVYAQALNCGALTPSGSPCRSCALCLAFENDEHAYFFAEVDAARHGQREHGAYLNELARTGSMYNVRQRMVVVNEIHCATPSWEETLLGLFETFGVAAFVLTTTAPERVSGPLRSRCTHVRTRLLTNGELVTFGRIVCDAERIAFEPEALALVAAASGGHVRDFVMELERLSANGSALTLTAAAAGLCLDWPDTALRVVTALARGKYDTAKVAVRDWTASPAEKARALRDAYVFVAHVCFGPTRACPEATVAFLLASPTLVDRLTAELRASFGGAGVPPLAYVLALAELWGRCVQTIHQDGDLQVELTRAAYAISPTDLTLPPLPDETEISAPETSARKRRAFGAQRLTARYKARSEFLSLNDVKGQLQAATMIAQRYGLWFNVRLRMPFAEYGLTDAHEAMKFLSDLKRALRLRLRSWTGDNETLLHFLQQTEVDADGALTGWLVMHIPPPHVATAYDWVLTQLPERVGELTPTYGADMWRAPQHGLPHRNHWSLMKELWRLIDPLLMGTSGSKKEPLKVLLAVPPQAPRAGGALPKGLRRWSASGELTTTEWTKAYKEKFGYLSVLDKQKWDVLEAGWELDELLHREREAARRREEIKKIERLFPPDRDKATDLTRERQLRAFFDRLPFDPLRRPRDTPPW